MSVPHAMNPWSADRTLSGTAKLSDVTLDRSIEVGGKVGLGAGEGYTLAVRWERAQHESGEAVQLLTLGAVNADESQFSFHGATGGRNSIDGATFTIKDVVTIRALAALLRGLADSVTVDQEAYSDHEKHFEQRMQILRNGGSTRGKRR